MCRLTTMNNIPIDINNRLVKLLPGVYYMLELRSTWDLISISEQSLAVFGFTPNEIFKEVRILTRTIIHPDDLAMVEHKKKDSLMADMLFSIEYRIRDKKGDIRYVRDQYTCYINDEDVWVMEGYICTPAFNIPSRA
jgi:hypothetical protein